MILHQETSMNCGGRLSHRYNSGCYVGAIEKIVFFDVPINLLELIEITCPFLVFVII